ncbi:MAG: TolC family protein [Fibrobacteres bacterium]|nr:TolC family protein [Fibrobacterota bacterium]
MGVCKMSVGKSMGLCLLSGWLAFGDTTPIPAWPQEERAWVRLVLQSNRDLARQRLSRQAAGLERRTAEKAMRPVWTLDASAETAPNAAGPVTFSLGNTDVTLAPGQDRYASQASVGLKQALPTGGQIGAEAGGGLHRPEGGAWSDTQTVSLSLRQPLLRGFGAQSEARAAIAAAKNEEALAEAELRAQLLSIIHEARSGYWNLLLQARQMQALLADSAYWEQSLRTAEAKHRLGDMVEDEYLRYRIQALGARQALLEARQTYRQKRAELLLLLGESPLRTGGRETAGGDSVLTALGLHFSDSLESDPPSPPVMDEEAMSLHHPTWLRLAHLRQRFDLQAQRARDAEKPQLDLLASWRKPLGGRSDARLGASFTWTLPTLSASRDLQEALLQAEAQKLDSSQTLAVLRTTLARLTDAYATQRERYQLAKEKSLLEGKRSRIAERRHALGDLDFTELQLSARDRLQAEQDVTIAYIALRLLNAEMEEWNGGALAASGVTLEGVDP